MLPLSLEPERQRYAKSRKLSSSLRGMACLLLVEGLVLGLLESVLLAALEHLKMSGFFGERALGQGNQTSRMLLVGG